MSCSLLRMLAILSITIDSSISLDDFASDYSSSEDDTNPLSNSDGASRANSQKIKRKWPSAKNATNGHITCT